MKKNYKKNKIDGSSYKTVIYLLAAKYAVASVNNAVTLTFNVATQILRLTHRLKKVVMYLK